jgi:copper ion binding protein
MKPNKRIQIEGMTCNHCKMRVEKALGNVEGVQTVKIDLQEGTALVKLTKDVANETLTQAVAAAGYRPVSIQ